MLDSLPVRRGLGLGKTWPYANGTRTIGPNSCFESVVVVVSVKQLIGCTHCIRLPDRMVDSIGHQSPRFHHARVSTHTVVYIEYISFAYDVTSFMWY